MRAATAIAVRWMGALVQPLNEIALCGIQIERWLTDLARMVGIEDRRRASRPCLTPQHLWHLGDLRVAGTHDLPWVPAGRAVRRHHYIFKAWLILHGHAAVDGRPAGNSRSGP